MVGSGLAGASAWRSVVWATAVSVVGDQLAKVALSVLVFQRSGSAALTALTYALTLVPEVAGGWLLGGVAARLAQRVSMAGAAALQAVLMAVITIPGVPFAVIAVAVAGVSALASPANAAQSVAAYDLLGAQRVARGNGTLTVVFEAGQVGGLAVGGGVVALVGVTAAVAADAVSFAGAALLLWVGLAGTSAAVRPAGKSERTMMAGWRAVTGDPVLRLLAMATVAVAWASVPAAVMAPLVAQRHAPAWWVGVLMAADCVGVIIAASLIRRAALPRHAGLVGPLLVASFVPFVAVAVAPALWLVAVLLLASGAGQGYLVATRSVFQDRVARVARPASQPAFSVVGAAMRSAQGVTALLAGTVASVVGSAGVAVGVLGAVATAQAVLVAVRWRVVRHRTATTVAETRAAA